MRCGTNSLIRVLPGGGLEAPPALAAWGCACAPRLGVGASLKPQRLHRADSTRMRCWGYHAVAEALLCTRRLLVKSGGRCFEPCDCARHALLPAGHLEEMRCESHPLSFEYIFHRLFTLLRGPVVQRLQLCKPKLYDAIKVRFKVCSTLKTAARAERLHILMRIAKELCAFGWITVGVTHRISLLISNRVSIFS